MSKDTDTDLPTSDPLDEELAKAAGLDDTAPSAKEGTAKEGTANDQRAGDMMAMSKPSAPPQPLSNQRPPTHPALALGLVLMVVGVVAVFMFGFQEAAIYSTDLNSFFKKGEKMAGRRVRIEGELVPGSLTKRDKPCEYRFHLRGKSAPVGSNEARKTLAVRYAQCVVPDTFRDVPQGGVSVTAEGILSDEGHFEAVSIMAKCASKYNRETHVFEGMDGMGGAKP